MHGQTEQKKINQLEVFCKNSSCISTIYINVNSIGIMFRKRGHVHKELGTLRFQIVLYVLVPVKSVRLNCNLKKPSGSKKIYYNNSFFRMC